MIADSRAVDLLEPMDAEASAATLSAQAQLDYERIERALVFLQQHFLDQPDLPAVARAADLSEYHFQRLFSRWAGVSPKRFLQFLTVSFAKEQLRQSKPILDAALDSGLSGPGRLHDLFVQAEAITPGEFKSRGQGLRIDYGFHATRFGACLLATTPRGICWLSFVPAGGRAEARQQLQAHWAGAELTERPQTTAPLAVRVFSPLQPPTQQPLSLLLMGTNFQLKVWEALLRIPPGTLTTYERIGESIGAAKASRAIGAAVGQNPIAYLIPCHRVIRKSGALGGYRWSLPRKQAILTWEATSRLGAGGTPRAN